MGVNRHASIELIAECAIAGCGGVVAYASGFAEIGAEGAALQLALVAAAGDMPVFGPNCYGFINYLDRALVWPDQHGGRPVPRGVAIITQSGNIGLNITMQKRALPIAYLITLGNQAQLSHAEVMQAVLDDPRVTAIGLHMESLGEPTAFAAACARARRQGVPVVALKTGRSAEGARIAFSHTAALASGDAVVDAFFRRIGVARSNDIPAFLETLKLLHLHGALPEPSIASMSCSGGEATLVADMAKPHGVTLKILSGDAKKDIGAALTELVSVSNPLDYHTFAWRNHAALAAIFAAMMRAGAALTILVLDYPRPDRCDPGDWDVAAAALHDAVRQTGARAAVLATLPDAFPEDRAEALLAQGILPMFGLSAALDAVHAASIAGAPIGGTPIAPCAPLAGTITFSEHEGKARLAAFGLRVPANATARSPNAAMQAAARLGFPVAVKAAGRTMTHKSEVGAVRLNLTTQEAAHEAAADLLSFTGEVLVERMIPHPVAELIVGIARDPVLGLYLVLGSGGILAELVADTATLVLPSTRAEISEALAGLRCAQLLRGFRGAPEGDIEAAADAVLSLQDFALAHQDRLLEVDVNPLMVCPLGQGAFAADVLLRMADHD